MLSPSQSYTLQDIKDSFAEPELHAAPALIDSIAKVDSSADHIDAELRGKPSPRIKLDIYFDAVEANGQTTLSIDSVCSCPRFENCAHAAAVLLFLLERRAGSAAAPGPSVNPGLRSWVESLRRASQAAARKPKAKAKATQAIYYLLAYSNYYQEYFLRTVKGRIDPSATQTCSIADWNNAERSLLSPPLFTDDSDLDVFRLMLKICGKGRLGDSAQLSGKLGAQLLAAALASGRAYHCTDLANP